MRNEKLLTLGIGAITAGLSYGLISGKNEVFVLLLFLLIGIFVFALLNHHNITFLGGYKLFLEERINGLLGDPVLVWEHVVVERKRWHIINLSLIGASTIILAGTLYICLEAVFANYPPRGANAMAVMVTIMLCLLGPGPRH